MRERIAKLVWALTMTLVIGLSCWFAAAHNPPIAIAASSDPVAVPRAKGPVPPAAEVARGSQVFAAQGCATCHAIAGEGNPRSPLDQVGARWDAEEMKAWITGTGLAVEMLPPAIAKRKQRYAAMPEDELKALVAYLLTLRSA